MRMDRREFIGGTLAGVAAATLPHPVLAQRDGADALVGVTWGGPWLEGTKPIVAAWQKQKPTARIAWELHEGSSAAIATKIRAAWPNVKHDLVHGNDPVIHVMMKEGWLELVDDLPNLKDIPEKFVLRDQQKRAMAVPHFAGAVVWGYRTDLVDKPITSLEQLLEPRFRGKVGLRAPSSWSGLPLVSMAAERGGNERNIDPGFEFLKDLARAGNVVTVANSGMDVVNSLNLGELVVFLAAATEWSRVIPNHPIKLLNRMPGSNSLKAYYTLGHWIIPKGPKSAVAKELANLFIEPENNEAYGKTIGAAPVNVKSKLTDPMDIFLKPDELDRFGYFCDYEYMSQNDQKWIERFDTEIRPLLAKR